MAECLVGLDIEAVRGLFTRYGSRALETNVNAGVDANFGRGNYSGNLGANRRSWTVGQPWQGLDGRALTRAVQRLV